MQSVSTQVPLGRYKDATSKKIAGATYTPPEFATFVAKEILKRTSHLKKEHSVSILDPAVGDGELLIALIEQLKASGYKKIDVFGYDTDLAAVETSRERIQAGFPDVSVSISQQDFLENLAVDDSSSSNLVPTPDSNRKFDLVIANPPYVRTQILGAKQAAALAKKFNLDGRVDIYYAFLLGLDQVLTPDSVVGIIVSNRFMSTKAGASVRRGLWEKFSIKGIWDFGDTRIFEAAVLPAVLVFSKRSAADRDQRTQFCSIYSSPSLSAGRKVPSIYEAFSEAGLVEAPNGKFDVRLGELNFGSAPSDVWRIDCSTTSAWLEEVGKNTFCTFSDVGKIRVGIKTTADNVFIRTDWDAFPKDERPELLKPLITHHIARRFKSEAVGRSQVLYPHRVLNGKRSAIPLDGFKNSRLYLEKHRAQLEGRKYVISAGRQWYEIWVPQDPRAWAKPKVVFRDISEKPTFWLDTDGSVVNGDCYWMTAEKEEDSELLWLVLAIANSKFIESFYDHKFNNKLYAGRRRFMTQYVEQFPLPDPSLKASKDLIQKVKHVYELLPDGDTTKLEQEIEDLVWKSFGVAPEEISR